MKQYKKEKKRCLAGSVMVETLLILVVLIALVAVFKTQITALVGDIFDKITRAGMRI